MDKEESRKDVLTTMTDRQILEAIALSQWRTEELVRQFIEGVGKNPMFKMMAGKLGV